MKKKSIKYISKKILKIIIVICIIAIILLFLVILNKYKFATLKYNINNNIATFVPNGKADYFMSFEGFGDSIWIYQLNIDETKLILKSISEDEGWNKLTEEKYLQYQSYFPSFIEIEEKGKIDFTNTYILIYNCDNNNYISQEDTTLPFFNYFYILTYNTTEQIYCAIFTETYQ